MFNAFIGNTFIILRYSFSYSATDKVFRSQFRLTITVCLAAYEDTRSEEYITFVNSISGPVSTECPHIFLHPDQN